MLADTRKIYELRKRLELLLAKETLEKDLFYQTAEMGMVRGQDTIEEFIKISRYRRLRDEITSLTKEEIMENPYLKNIEIPEVVENNISLSKKRIIRSNTVTPYKLKKRDLETLELMPSYFVCDRILKFPAIIENDNNLCWMSVEPSEIESFRPLVDRAEGSILLGGCGLGYIAYMLSEKENVNDIEIVELNGDIIKIFQEHILPQFPNKDKIKVVSGDILKYLRENNLSKYNHINIDVWHDVIDMLPIYLPCLEIENQYDNVEFSYWLEEELKEFLQKTILYLVADMDEYSGFPLLAREIGEYLIERTQINNYQNLKELLEFNDFRGILFDWYKNNDERFEVLVEATTKHYHHENKVLPDIKNIRK